MCELSFYCLARSQHLEVLMVISIDSMLIKQLENYWMSFLELVLLLDKTEDGFNSILPIVSFWPVSQQVCQNFLISHKAKFIDVPAGCISWYLTSNLTSYPDVLNTQTFTAEQ